MGRQIKVKKGEKNYDGNGYGNVLPVSEQSDYRRRIS